MKILVQDLSIHFKIVTFKDDLFKEEDGLQECLVNPLLFANGTLQELQTNAEVLPRETTVRFMESSAVSLDFFGCFFCLLDFLWSHIEYKFGTKI